MTNIIRCIAVDDEPLALELISQYVEKTPGLELIQTFDDAIQAGEFIRNHDIDLLLLDINMPDITGLDLLKSLPQKPMTIFTTAYKKFAYEGFELDIIDYLLKPISYDRFTKAIVKVQQKLKARKAEKQQDGYFLVRSEYKLVKIELSSILYFEGVEDYVKIYLENEKPIMSLMTLKSILEKLSPQKFQRIHRSYIVSVDKIKYILNKKITLSNGAVLPISDSYAGFIQQWNQSGL